MEILEYSDITFYIVKSTDPNVVCDYLYYSRDAIGELVLMRVSWDCLSDTLARKHLAPATRLPKHFTKTMIRLVFGDVSIDTSKTLQNLLFDIVS